MFERDFTKKIASVTEKIFAAPDFMLSNKKKKDRDPDRDSRLFQGKYMKSSE